MHYSSSCFFILIQNPNPNHCLLSSHHLSTDLDNNLQCLPTRHSTRRFWSHQDLPSSSLWSRSLAGSITTHSIIFNRPFNRPIRIRNVAIPIWPVSNLDSLATDLVFSFLNLCIWCTKWVSDSPGWETLIIDFLIPITIQVWDDVVKVENWCHAPWSNMWQPLYMHEMKLMHIQGYMADFW